VVRHCATTRVKVQKEGNHGESNPSLSKKYGRYCTSMDLVAQEIETVIYGESDDDNDEDSQLPSTFETEDNVSDEDGRSAESHNLDRTEIDTIRRTGQCRRRYNDKTVATRMFPFRGDEINSYGLFDDPQGRSGRSKPNSCLASSSSSRSIIYAKKYQLPGNLLTPILVFLSATFAILLVIRVVTSLMSAAVGIVILLFLVGRMVNEFLTHPVRLIRNIHASPVRYFATLGAMLGAIHVLLVGHLSPISRKLIHCSTSWISSDFGHGLKEWFQVNVTTTSYTGDTIQIDLVMLWRLIRGIGYGIEIGCLWIIIFGKSSKSTALSRYLHRRVWRPLKRYYRRSVVLLGHPTTRNDDNLGHSYGDARNNCSICLETFDDIIYYESNRQRDSPLLNRYQLLPCHHCFHRDCARNWLTIQQTCPICRDKVMGMRGCADNE
jgi:hypothetical protein